MFFCVQLDFVFLNFPKLFDINKIRIDVVYFVVSYNLSLKTGLVRSHQNSTQRTNERKSKNKLYISDPIIQISVCPFFFLFRLANLLGSHKHKNVSLQFCVRCYLFFVFFFYSCSAAITSLR